MRLWERFSLCVEENSIDVSNEKQAKVLIVCRNKDFSPKTVNGLVRIFTGAIIFFLFPFLNFLFINWFLEREKHQFVILLIYAFIGWCLHVPWLGIEPTTLVYWEDALTNWATWAGPSFSFFFPSFLHVNFVCILNSLVRVFVAYILTSTTEVARLFAWR